MKENGFNIAGVEPSAIARANAEKITSTPIVSDVNQIQNTFDVITLWHVLEHVSDLNETIIKLRTHLKKDGTILIAVPNHKSHDAQTYGMTWAGYDVPRHLWHFDQNTMRKLLNNHRLKIIDTIPMKLDAFYVSMLSEKYISNGQSILTFTKGLLNGLVSNLKAKNNNYSSIIYIARHE
jgi:2-polyprenyl-3-methyl-5-hydroxy-6-metoxy-1,4-benzoquinol methylase